MAATAEQALKEAKLDADGFHSRSKILQVEVAALKIDRSYQRELSQRIVDEISGDWNEVASELILVSNRGNPGTEHGGLYVVNGQHRTMAARKLKHKKIWARVVDLTDLDDPGAVEADLRLKTNSKLADRSPERFKAQLRAGNPESLDIVRVLDEYGTFINLVPTKDGNGLNSIAAVEQIYQVDDNGSLLAETLSALKAAYGTINHEIANANSLKAVSWFLQHHAMEANFDKLAESLRALGPAALLMRSNMRRGSEGGATWTNMYRVLVDLYNDGLIKKHRLTPTVRGVGLHGNK